MNKVKTFSTEKNVIFVRYLCDDEKFHDFYFDPDHTSIRYDPDIGFRFDCTVWEKGLPIDKTYHFVFNRIRTFVYNDSEKFLEGKYESYSYRF